MISIRVGVWLPVLLTLLSGARMVQAPRIGQPQSNHHFADQRGWLGIPNFGDVAPDLAFAVIGVWALIFLSGKQNQEILGMQDSTDRAFSFFRDYY
jgi:hypothetical protein